MTIQNKLLPFRDVGPHEEINLFALNTTGEAGLFVKPTAFDLDNADGYSSIGVGATYGNTFSNRYESKAKIALSASGDTKYSVLGVMLKDTREVDENGESLLFHPELATKLNCVISGQNVPVAKRGMLLLKSGAYLGTPAIGSVGVISHSGSGRIQALAPSAVTGAGYTSDQIVGKFISANSAKFGGNALFLLDL